MINLNLPSKRFLAKSFCGVKTFLSIFFLGSSVFASGYTLPQEGNVVQVPVEQKKDLSVFVEKLGERLKGVVGELMSLSSSAVSSASASITTPATTTGTIMQASHFEDIAQSPYQEDILSLVQLGVLGNQQAKFYPNNFLRKYEMIIMMVKYALVHQQQQVPQVVFPTRGWFSDVAQNASYAPYVAYAYQQDWLQEMIVVKTGSNSLVLSPNAYLSRAEVCRTLTASCSSSFVAQTGFITRGEFVHILVSGGQSPTAPEVQTPTTGSASGDSLLKKVTTVFALVK